MKIIITESQYNLLIENNFEKNKKLIYNMWDEGYSIDDITELIGKIFALLFCNPSFVIFI